MPGERAGVQADAGPVSHAAETARACAADIDAPSARVYDAERSPFQD